MRCKEFDDEHIITHKIVHHTSHGDYTIGVGPINMCRRYVEEHINTNLSIIEL